MAILNANNMNSPELTKFVKQDTASIFKDPKFRALANSVTDLAARADVIKQGGSLKPISNELTNIDIDNLLKYQYKIKDYHGCFIKNELPNKLKNGFYVINLNGHSHWTGLYKNGKNYYYFDSYGFPAAQDVENRIPKEYIWSDKDIQTYSSTACGFYVIAWIRYLSLKRDKEELYKEFINKFKVNKKINEKILNSLL